MTTFLCVQCDKRFEAEPGRPRCPQCLRIHGIVPVEEATGGPALPRRYWPLAGAIGLAIVLAALFFWRSAGSEDRVVGAKPAEVLDTLASEEREKAAQALKADQALVEFAQKHAKGEEPQARAQALYSALFGDLAARRFRPASLQVPPAREPLGVAGVFKAIQEQEGSSEPALYPLEVSMLLSSALGAVDIESQVVDVQAFEPGATTPLDPSGTIGYYAVVVGAPESERQQLYDPFGGRPVGDFTAGPGWRLLQKGQLLAAFLGSQARAWHQSGQSQSGQALALSDAALKIDPRSAVLRSVRAEILLMAGGPVEAEVDAVAALQLRGDAPREHNLARILLLQGHRQDAEKHLQRALTLSPQFARAQVTQASLWIARGEFEPASEALEAAQARVPNLPELHLTRAQLYAAQGELDPAVAAAVKAVELRPADIQLRVSLCQLYRAAERTADVKRCAAEVLADAPAAQVEGLRTRLSRLLGQDALQ